jgi:hypothetical protein
MSVRESNRRKLRLVASYCLEKRWKVLLLTEITAQEPGIIWLGEEDEKTVIVHGKK